MKITKKSLLSLTIWIGALNIIGWLIGVMTMKDLSTWYVTLNRSPLSPPNHIFGIVWPILYAMIGVSGHLIWSQKSQKQFKELAKIKKLYIAQLILNWIWTPLFFQAHQLFLSFIIIPSIILLTLMLMKMAYKKEKMITWLLVPYIAWLSFASYLNFYAWFYN